MIDSKNDGPSVMLMVVITAMGIMFLALCTIILVVLDTKYSGDSAVLVTNHVLDGKQTTCYQSANGSGLFMTCRIEK